MEDRDFANATEAAVLAELGARLERRRLDLDRTQAELAREAGVSLNTVRRLEDGASVQLANWIRVLRALGLGRGLAQLVPAPEPRPLDLLEQTEPRMRASGGAHEERRRPPGWAWGDER